MAAPHLKHEIRRARRPHDPSRDNHLIERLDATLAELDGSVAFVWPLPGEPDLRPLMRRLDDARRPLALPVVLGPGRPLAFRPWRANTAMQPGPHATRHPVDTGEPPVRPDIILVPLLAFDRRRNRIGRGGGFYDRTLSAHPNARTIGFAHATAEIAAVPAEPHDRPLHLIVTDRETI